MELKKRRRLFLLRLGCIDDVRPNWLILGHFLCERSIRHKQGSMEHPL